MLEKIEAWLNADDVQEGASVTNGDFLRTIIESLYKAIVELLNAIGEWPIDIK